MTPLIPPPIQRLKDLLGRLVMDLSASVAWGGISMPLNVFIGTRILDYLRRIQRIAERIRAGTFVLRRRSAAPRAPASRVRSPGSPAPVRQGFGWLLPLLPMQPWDRNGYRNAVESLLADPEMVALIQAAPGALGRPLRSLCWMFRLKPPPALAPPRAAPPRAAPLPAEEEKFLIQTASSPLPLWEGLGEGLAGTRDISGQQPPPHQNPA